MRLLREILEKSSTVTINAPFSVEIDRLHRANHPARAANCVRFRIRPKTQPQVDRMKPQVGCVLRRSVLYCYHQSEGAFT